VTAASIDRRERQRHTGGPEVEIDRRDFMRLAGFAGAVFVSGLSRAGGKSPDFYFVQMSDTHWGFKDPDVNPDADGTLGKAIAAVNQLEVQPDFIVFTGDLTHTTPDAALRRARMVQFREIVGRLRVRDVRFMPGEHDAALDNGDAFRERFGETHYTFDHKGVHFIVLDNVSDPTASVGEAQIAWLKADLARQRRDAQIVIFTHRPLFDLFPNWDWATHDGSQVLEAFAGYQHVTVFYGHIHQEHHHLTGNIAHHAAKSLIFPLPAPGSVPKREPVKWLASSPYAGLGYRRIAVRQSPPGYGLVELSVPPAGASS
jgi:3',5'-cyclic AMP phosphodiesterase CpdA